jgi:hypothetical protein
VQTPVFLKSLLPSSSNYFKERRLGTTAKIEAATSWKILTPIWHYTRRHIQEDCNFRCLAKWLHGTEAWETQLV